MTIVLPGWNCHACGCFNGEEREKLSRCRSCNALKREHGVRYCIACPKPAESPTLPLCMRHDLLRLKNGWMAADIKKLATEGPENFSPLYEGDEFARLVGVPQTSTKSVVEETFDLVTPPKDQQGPSR